MRRAIFKAFVLVTTTFILAAASLAAAASAKGRAQSSQSSQPSQPSQSSAGRLRLDSLERLAPKAADSVNIEIDDFLIRFAGSMLSGEDADDRTVKELIEGLRGVYVRSYEFKTEGQFADADVSAIREQLRGPGWRRVLDVEKRGIDFGDAEVYVASSGGRVEGFALLVVEPKELTVVNLVGTLDLDKLRRLADDLDFPRVRVRRKRGGGN